MNKQSRPHMRSVHLEMRPKQVFIWFDSNVCLSTNFRTSKLIYVPKEWEEPPSKFFANENCAVFPGLFLFQHGIS